MNQNKVKALGILAMIDEGETDWKVMCIDVKDELAEEWTNGDVIGMEEYIQEAKGGGMKGWGGRGR